VVVGDSFHSSRGLSFRGSIPENISLSIEKFMSPVLTLLVRLRKKKVPG